MPVPVELSDETLEAIRKLNEIYDATVRVFVIDSENDPEFQHLTDRMETEGFKWSAMSNTGLPRGKVRVTYLHESCFRKPGDPPLQTNPDGSPKTSKPKVDLREWLKNHESSSTDSTEETG